MLQTVRAGKVDENNGVVCLVAIFPSLTGARNKSLLKQFTYMHLKCLVSHFQQMVYRKLFIGL